MAATPADVMITFSKAGESESGQLIVDLMQGWANKRVEDMFHALQAQAGVKFADLVSFDKLRETESLQAIIAVIKAN